MTSQSGQALVGILVLAAAALTAGCGNGPAAQAPPGAGPPATAVTLLTLEEKPIERTSEFIATIRSLRSVTVQPEVEGIVTRIFVKAGDRVSRGTPIAQIDPARQQATLRGSEANRAGTAADVEYWRQQVRRFETLVEAGAISRQEFEQAQTSLRNAESRLAALDAQLRENQVQLGYHRIEAAHAGVVGEVAVRPGNRVTTSTVITTIDENASLEAYIQVPLDRMPELRIGLPVQILDADGRVVATNPITFVAPRVEEATQTVLAKSALGSLPPTARVQQFVRTRIVWRTEPGLTIPVTAVTRISGQHFCFVAEPAGNGLTARQRPIQVGEIIGNDYLVVGGLSAGDRVVVQGIQKIGDGAPIRAE